MRNYQSKSNIGGLPDSITVTKFGGGEFNSIATELENAVLSSNQTLAPADGTGEVSTQLAMAIAVHGAGGAAYHADTGAVNAYVLNPISPMESPPTYFDGFLVIFEPGTDNTGASTVNVASIGIKNITLTNGNALTGGEISGTCFIKYNLSDDRFELLYSSALFEDKSNFYVVDATQADQGVTSTNALTMTVFDVANHVGTSKYAKILFTHNPESGNQTYYNFDTGVDLSTYPNLYFEFEPGAMIDHVTGDEIFKVYSPENLMINDQQTITTVDMLAFSKSGTVWPEMWGAAGDATTNDHDAIQYAIDSMIATSGGIIILKNVYLSSSTISITNDNIKLKGNIVGASGITSTQTAGILLNITGTRHTIKDLIIYRNTFHSASTSVVVSASDIVQCKFINCWIQGGYYAMSITGGVCSDNIIKRCIFSYSTGPSMCWIARGVAGLNGSHFFHRCLFNQGYGGATVPSSGDFIGAWAGSTAYSVNNIVDNGGYLYRCTVAGTSAAAGGITPAFYGTNITDGTVTWVLMAPVAYNGIHVDTGTSYITVRECDLTGPFSSSIRISDDLAGDDPYQINIIHSNADGPINNAIFAGHGREIRIDKFSCSNSIGPGTTYGIFVQGTEDASIINCESYTFSAGIFVDMDNVKVIGNTVTGCSGAGIAVGANKSKIVITNNIAGSTTSRGANGTGIVVNAGTSDYYVITNNIVQGASTGVTDLGTGVNKLVANNF